MGAVPGKEGADAPRHVKIVQSVTHACGESELVLKNSLASIKKPQGDQLADQLFGTDLLKLDFTVDVQQRYLLSKLGIALIGGVATTDMDSGDSRTGVTSCFQTNVEYPWKETMIMRGCTGEADEDLRKTPPGQLHPTGEALLWCGLESWLTDGPIWC